jgi:hypothetical protein
MFVEERDLVRNPPPERRGMCKVNTGAGARPTLRAARAAEIE